MEDLLLQISNECSNNKLVNLKTASQTAYDLLQSQTSLLRDPAHDLRAKCFSVFQIALETKKSKFVAYALSGFHKILRDDRFQSNFESEDDSLWLPSQLLYAVSSILTQSDDTQVDILKVLLNVACSSYWTVNGRIIIQILSTCCEVYEAGTEAVKTASQAAANQTLRAYCHLLDIESQEARDSKMREVGSGGIDCFNELIPVLQYICSRLDEAQNIQTNTSALLLLEGLHTVVSSLPQRIHTNSHFTKFLWQKLCPVLIGLMATPKINTTLPFTRLQTLESLPHHKIIYSIAGQLVRVVGCVGSLRPVLESIYHRMLLYPRPVQRIEAIKALTELWRSPNRLVDFAGPLLIEDDKGCQQSDMALTRLVMDSLQECSASKDSAVVAATVACVETLLSTLLQISSGQCINDLYVSHINFLYPNLESCDYKGPLTYQTLCRLPKVYTDSVGVLDKDIEDVEREDGDGTSEESSNCSDVTDFENSDLDDMDNLPSKICFHESLGSVQQEKIYSKESGDCERDNARYFIDTMLEFLPSITHLKYAIEIDAALQKFASDYCQGLYYNKSKNDDIELAIVNADGIYLATYSALSLNLKLINQGYYTNTSDNIPMNENEFVNEVEESGVLVYLSSRWLCEVYQQVLCTDLITSSGIGGNVALRNLLADLGGIFSESEVLSDCVKLERAACRQQITPEMQAGLKLTRRILTCCWESVLVVLTVGVKGDQTTMPVSLQALHNAVLLCNLTGLQKRSGSVFCLLTNACCTTKEGKPSLSASHALSLDVLLSRALELASHAPHSWSYVLKCCLHVSKLESAIVHSQTLKITGKLTSKQQETQDINMSLEGDVPCLLGDMSGISVLPQSVAVSILGILSHHVDKLFEDAAVKLKLAPLLSFCGAVCAASEKQLRNIGSQEATSAHGHSGSSKRWWPPRPAPPPPPPLLSRLSQLVIKASRSGRPLLHIMKLWSTIGPHLMHAACHKDPAISKMAVTSIHGVMTTLLNENTELAHFHFNEALFKPFENLLCLELCDTDIQDLVVNCICEFVETSQAEIRSGWRPLFRALGGVSTPCHVASLLEVFQVFINTDNPAVFANAAMDFIQCLIKHVRCNGAEEEVDEDTDCRSVLNFVTRCSQLLCMMYSMPSCPRFNTARRLEERMDEGREVLVKDIGGCLAVWAELIEGLASVVPLCPPVCQSPVLDVLFTLLTQTIEQPGINYTVYCVTYIVLSMIQRWLITNSHNVNLWEKQTSSFKQYCGQTTHFVVRLLGLLHGVDKSDQGTIMLQHLVNIMVECVTVPVESVARLGCACLRHMVVNGAETLKRCEWLAVAEGLAQGARLVLQPVTILNSAFSDNCHQYYGDLAHIKVAARKDSTPVRNLRLRHLAQQVLLLESQRTDLSIGGNDENNNDERSYVLLIYEDVNASTSKDCVPLCNLLIALLAHQMLLQTIGTILLQGSQHIIPSLAGVVPNNSDKKLLLNLPEEAIEKLLQCLELSYSTAVEFDSRPGLKFLLQKVAQLERAANLYRQAGAAWTIHLITLFDLCLNKTDCEDNTKTNIKEMKEFLPKLRQSLEQMCDTYIDVLLDKDGVHSAVDRINEKIVFIIAQTDDLDPTENEMSSRIVIEASGTDENNSETKEEMENTIEIQDPEEVDTEKSSLIAEIERQKRDSICKDREAHMDVWSEMLVSALELLCQLDSEHLRTLLPAAFPTVRSLTAHATHVSLKHQLAQLYDKLAHMYGFIQIE